jgi:BirA family transcriptional regulator, biotin operon repressor / biotin---[acetyl-CoA-carboxylase] ligase
VRDRRIGEEALTGALRTRQFGRTVYAFDAIDSTNQFAKSLALRGHVEGTLVYAEHQTRGRGRWGRNWESSRGKGLLFSVLLRPDPCPVGIGGLTLMAATSVTQVLERHLDLRPKLRWPNDVILDGRKVAGVLTEAQRGADGVSFAVLGLGLNVSQTEADFPADLLGKAGSLESTAGRPVDRLALFAELIVQLERDYRRFRASGPEFALNRWVRRNAILGRTVTLRTRAGEETGRVRGFRADGRLVLVGEDGKEKRFSDGEVVEVHHASGY